MIDKSLGLAANSPKKGLPFTKLTMEVSFSFLFISFSLKCQLDQKGSSHHDKHKNQLRMFF